jgi:hypothetical protein
VSARRHHPILWMVEWLEKNEVRLFFSTGRVVEVKLPVRSARRAHIVQSGLGLDPGDGLDMCALELHKMRGRVWEPGLWR